MSAQTSTTSPESPTRDEFPWRGQVNDDGLADEQGPIPAFGPAQTDSQGRIVLTDEEWEARRSASIRTLKAIADITDETDTDEVWGEVFRSLQGTC